MSGGRIPFRGGRKMTYQELRERRPR